MQVLAERRLFNVKDYHEMVATGILKPNERVELINGEIIKMSPIKSAHASVVDILSEYLIVALHGKAIVRVQNPISIDAYSEPEPDILVAHWQTNRYRAEHPQAKDTLLLIEVADSTLHTDRNVKAKLYAKAGISEYWIINVVAQEIEIYRNPIAEIYTETTSLSGAAIASCLSIPFEISVQSLFE